MYTQKKCQPFPLRDSGMNTPWRSATKPILKQMEAMAQSRMLNDSKAMLH